MKKMISKTACKSCIALYFFEDKEARGNNRIPGKRRKGVSFSREKNNYY